MPSRAADSPLARASSSLHLSASPERPTTPPTPEMPLSPSPAPTASFTLTAPSPTFAAPTSDSPLDQPAASSSSHTELETRGRLRSRSPPPSASLALEQPRFSPPATLGTRSTSLSRRGSCSPRRDTFQSGPYSGSRPRSTSINTLIRTSEDPLTFSVNFELSLEYNEDDSLSDPDCGSDMTEEEWQLHMEEVANLGCHGEGCNCNPDDCEDQAAELLRWESFNERWQNRRSQQETRKL